VVLGKRVVVCLRDHAKPLTGMIEWIERDQAASKNAPPRFRLRGMEFGHDEIESIVQE
jgi:chemotaxis receptor (MCP) glutamine deamidase CheD